MLLAIALSACGLRPLYGERTAGQEDIQRITIAPIADRPGQILRNYLLDRVMSSEQPPLYQLQVSLAENKFNTGIAQDSSSTYGELYEIANFTLSDIATGKTLLSGQARARNGYSLLYNGFASISAERQTRGRLLISLGDEILLRLALFFDRS